jgi:hypothetical protein
MATELTGILAIFYYIYWHQLDWAQKSGVPHPNGNGRGGKSSSASSGPNRGSNNRLHSTGLSGNGGGGGGHRGGYKITDIYNVDKRSLDGGGKLPPHLPGCNAYLIDTDKHICGDFDIPFPPPPPPQTSHYLPVPRDYNLNTSGSDEEGSLLFPPPSTTSTAHRKANKDRDHRNTPV